MRCHSILAALCTIALAASALAAPTLPGINIRWDNCFADGGTMNRAFACDTNAGAELAVMSLQLDSSMPSASGMEMRVSFKAAAPTLPAWWDFKNSGACRQSALSFISEPLLTGSCVDWNQGHGGAGGIGAYRVDELGPASAVLLIATAVPQSNLVGLDPGTEYIAGAVRITHANTAGTGSCGGCSTPVCILFTSLKVTTPVGVQGDRLFTTGANGVDSQIIHWQNGKLANLSNSCTGTFNCATQFDCQVTADAAPTAARRSTWGAVKSLYK